MPISRRQLIMRLVATAVLTNLPTASFAKSTADTKTDSTALVPARLQAGDTIGIVAPSSNVLENQEIGFASDIIRSLGFKVKQASNLFARHGYLAGSDQARANDLNQMFNDKEVDGIFCLRGGYGSPRILPLLDYDAISKHPKVLIGYSDITALLNAIYAKTGLITFHGPIARQSFSPYTLSAFQSVVVEGQHNIELATPPSFEPMPGQAEQDNRITIINQGIATGKLIGGNLSLMVKLIGTEYEPDYQDNILFLEDVEEAPYRIDGMLTHLRLANRLNKLAGIVFGKCTDCEASGNSLSIEQVLFDRFGDLNIPVIKGSMIGHIDDMATLPIGATVRLDANKGILSLISAAVS